MVLMLARGNVNFWRFIVEILFIIVESDGIAKYIWVEMTTAPCLAVPMIEESQKGNNFCLRFY